MLKKILIGIVVIVGGLFVYAAMLPSDMNISRELLIKATPETLFSHINNSRKANDWMPWKDSDPEMKMQFLGPDEGVGSQSSWESEGQMGTGKAVVVESITNQSVKTQLTYVKPMAMEQLAEVSLLPNNDGTIVRWSVTGNNSLIGRVACIFMNMDKMVGAQFEKGLNKLKTITEQ